jgi:hypothetical protein
MYIVPYFHPYEVGVQISLFLNLGMFLGSSTNIHTHDKWELGLISID